ncbi:ribosomal RNA small subunit methyltransferase A [Candidatus Saccharibacteria bacterium]|nr:ribosomal RNA small subunit methyltransferase A [Candidatus Saccharibacteria bacterium]
MSLQNKKSLGQHWLKDRQILDEIAELACVDDPNTYNTCLEIGPGLGFLTSSLLRVFPKVIAVEFDKKLADNLPNSFPGKNLEVENADFLQFDLSSIPDPYIVAGNIPYYITSPIIMKLLQANNKPKRIVLLVQKEVAERVVAGATSISRQKPAFFSLAVQNLAEVALGPVVKRELFTPPPKVDSQVIMLIPRQKPVISSDALKLAERAFSAPRKKLIKNLSPYYSTDSLKLTLSSLEISLDARPADLCLSDWQRLYNSLNLK